MSGRGRNGMLTALAAMLLFVCGCTVQLFDNLTEEAANEVLAALLENEIPAQKQSGTEGTYKVLVEESQFARAVQILKVRGLPRPVHGSLGEIFKKEGLLSTPLEEKARYMYALSEELSKTISNIDGVLSARVHIVLPEMNELGEKITPATVSVFVKHSELAGPKIAARQDEIKKLVGKSIQGIEPENIYITLFPADEQLLPPQPQMLYETVLGIRVMRGSAYQIWILAGAAAALFAATGGLVYWFRVRKAPAKA